MRDLRLKLKLGVAVLASYVSIFTAGYVGGSAGLEVQAALCGEEVARARAERIIGVAETRPYHPGRLIFAGVEAAASSYLQKMDDISSKL